MSRRAITDEQRIDAYISTAPRDALVRLQSEVSAALKYRDFGQVHIDTAPFKRKPKDAAQMPLVKEQGL